MTCRGSGTAVSRVRRHALCFTRNNSGVTALEYAFIGSVLGGVMLAAGGASGRFIVDESESTAKYYALASGPITVATLVMDDLASLGDNIIGGDIANNWAIASEVQGWTSDNGIEVHKVSAGTYGGFPGDSGFIFESDVYGGGDGTADSYSKTYDHFNDYSDVEISFYTYLRTGSSTQQGSDGVNVHWNGELVDTIYPTKGVWEKVSVSVNTSDGDRSGVLTLEDIGTDDGYGAYLGDVTVAEVAAD